MSLRVLGGGLRLQRTERSQSDITVHGEQRVEKTAAVSFDGVAGATRSHVAPRYDLLPKAAIDRLVKRLTLGAEIHGANNWRKGGPEFQDQCKRHLVEHLLNYLEGDKSDDHLSAVLCNAAFLAHFEAQ